jgi:hypothetical protein
VELVNLRGLGNFLIPLNACGVSWFNGKLASTPHTAAKLSVTVHWLYGRTVIKVKLSLQQAVEAHRVVRRRIGSEMAVRLSVLHAGRPSFTPRKIPGNHFCYRLSRPQGNSTAGRMTLSGIEPPPPRVIHEQNRKV